MAGFVCVLSDHRRSVLENTKKRKEITELAAIALVDFSLNRRAGYTQQRCAQLRFGGAGSRTGATTTRVQKQRVYCSNATMPPNANNWWHRWRDSWCLVSNRLTKQGARKSSMALACQNTYIICVCAWQLAHNVHRQSHKCSACSVCVCVEDGFWLGNCTEQFDWSVLGQVRWHKVWTYWAEIAGGFARDKIYI